MNKNIVLIAVILMLLANSCLLKSLNSFFKKENVCFSDALIGSWIDNDSTCWIVQQYSHDNFFDTHDSTNHTYLVTCKEKDKPRMLFLACLFVINGEYFIDFQIKDSKEYFYQSQINAHILAKVNCNEESIRLQWYNNSWFGSLLKKNNKIKLKYEEIDGSYVLTSSTSELQNFITRYGNDPMAFKANYEAYEEDKQKDAFVVTLYRHQYR